jgi:hypothetical protein
MAANSERWVSAILTPSMLMSLTVKRDGFTAVRSGREIDDTGNYAYLTTEDAQA